jgi:hypothetical protein
MRRVRLLDGILIVGLVIVTFVVLLTLVPHYTRKEVTAELAQIRAELPLARARWESHHVNSYDMDVTGSIPLACLFDVTLQVREGELATVIEEDRAGQLTTGSFEANALCPFQALLVTAMFQQVEESLVQIDPAEMYLLVEFDPVYGFVTDFQIGCRNRPVSDCGRRFTFKGFRPVAED